MCIYLTYFIKKEALKEVLIKFLLNKMEFTKKTVLSNFLLLKRFFALQDNK
jgi:hypothetical protein